MTQNEFLKEFQDILQRDEPVDLDGKLADMEEWDSLTAMATSFFLKSKFKIDLPLENFKEFQTARDIWNLIQN